MYNKLMDNSSINTTEHKDIWYNKCPVCKNGHLIESESKSFMGLITNDNFICQVCGAKFVKKSSDEYGLKGINDEQVNNSVWQQYQGLILTAREWQTIANGGMSDAKQQETDMERFMQILLN